MHGGGAPVAAGATAAADRADRPLGLPGPRRSLPRPAGMPSAQCPGRGDERLSGPARPFPGLAQQQLQPLPPGGDHRVSSATHLRPVYRVGAGRSTAQRAARRQPGIPYRRSARPAAGQGRPEPALRRRRTTPRRPPGAGPGQSRAGRPAAGRLAFLRQPALPRPRLVFARPVFDTPRREPAADRLRTHYPGLARRPAEAWPSRPHPRGVAPWPVAATASPSRAACTFVQSA